MVIPLRFRPGLAERHAAQEGGPARIRDVERRDLGSEHAPFLGRVLPEAQQQVRAERVEVGRVAADLQLAADDRVGRPGEVDDVQRIDLPERDDVADVADEPDAEDALALAESALATELHELSAALL